MDFTNITDDQLRDAIDKASAKQDYANLLMFEGELNRRIKSAKKDTSVVEQGLGGLYEGLATGAGATVDLMAAGLRAVGMDVGEKPFGGSESIKSGLQAISMDKAIPEVGPQTFAQKVARGSGEVIGETVPATLGLLAAAPKAAANAAPTTWNAFKQLLSGMKEEAVAAPAAFAATEAAIAGGAGATGATVEELFPENPTAKMIAETLGALGAGVGVKALERLAAKKVQGPLTGQELKQEAGRIYDAQRDSGLSAPANVTENIYTNALNRANNEGIVLPDGKIDPDMPKMKAVMSFLESYSGKEMTGANILRIRKVISDRMYSAKGAERNAIRSVLREFDANTAELAPSIKVANAMYSRAMKADQIEDLQSIAKASERAANNDLEGAYRTQFRNLLNRITRGQELGWTPDEVDQIRQIVEGGSMENIMRFIGKLQPSGVVSGAASLGLPFSAAMQVTGDPYVSGTIAGGVAGLGVAGRQTAGALQKQNIERLYQSIVQGRNMTPAAQQRLRAALTAYFSGQAAAQ